MRIAQYLFCCLILTGCASISEISQVPEMTPVGSGLKLAPRIEPMSLSKKPVKPVNYSLWPGNKESIFHDQRAKSVGDVLTVNIQINDRASLDNKFKRSRDAKNKWGLGADFSFDGSDYLLAETFNGSVNSNVNSANKYDGSGSVARSERIKLSIAAVITDVLPNGNYIISGTQEVRVNYEMRILSIGGIVRPEDVSDANAVSYEKIAEARISYGGRGRSMEVQQPGFGQQLLDMINPF